MKVVSRIDFLKYPEGTVYAKGKEWYFEDICIKGETFPPDEQGYPGDFLYLDTSWPYLEDFKGDAFAILENSLETGKSFEAEKYHGRDGSFDLDDLFLIYEKTDLLVLKEHIEAAIAIA